MLMPMPPSAEALQVESLVSNVAVSRLERMAHQLASTHQLAKLPDANLLLLKHLPSLAHRLDRAHRYFIDNASEELALSYAAEWVLDNYYIVDQALHQIKEDLPATFYRELPKLDMPVALAGYPRVYVLARSFVWHEQGQFDAKRMVNFMAAYQQTQPLTMGEVWAAPIMLRFVLIETLVEALDRITGLAGQAISALSPLEHTLSDTDLVANTIQSLRRIDSQDWKTFFEDVALVEQILCKDPASIYPRMDFATRNQYRHELEKIAHATHQDEVTVAQQAIDLANTAYAVEQGGKRLTMSFDQTIESTEPLWWANLFLPRPCHVGYYLIAEGRAVLEKQLRYQPTPLEQLRRWLFAHPTLVYLGGIGLGAFSILWLVWTYTVQVGGGFGMGLLVGLLTLVPALTLAVNFVNWIITHTVAPRTLPKLNFVRGIPTECRTMVVVPVLIANASDINTLVRQLELHYLRNPDPHLTYGLLSDFADATAQEMPEDAALLEQMRLAIDALNQQYPRQPFYFFHRQRLWNASENCWMGWERKRGKLHEFNRLLRGSKTSSYHVKFGNLQILSSVRYVITLDADTLLPRDEAQRLVGTLAHPLNQAYFDPKTGQVSAGYTVLQPRTAVKPTSVNQSFFTRVFAGDSGLDLYTLAVSDAYQDFFGVGIYVGKGIYDVDAFERTLRTRVPDNTLLSHDLFEGIHGRVGLVTDVVIYEDYPAHYLINVWRSHRWVRGDWQLLPWLWSMTPRQDARGKHWARNDLAVIDRWKIFDNLRRSLLAPALLLLFLAGWTVLPGWPWFWSLVGLLTPAFSLVASGLMALGRGTNKEDKASLASQLGPVRDNALRWLLFLAFLPHETLLTLDAIGRTLVRMFITHKRLLQWTTAARTVRIFGDEMTPILTLRKMWPSILLVTVLASWVGTIRPTALPLAAPFFLVWLLSSELAYQISRPVYAAVQPLTPEQRNQLRKLARQTWLFYEHFVGPDDNWLPPDHFQEAPRGVVAHRTSPTNIGFYLLSLLAAHDLGYVNHSNLAIRLQFAFETLARLERYRGHFLNWIDTGSLAPLQPRYVSTVDSGNLAACLLVLKHGCLALPQTPLWSGEWWEGLLDTVGLLMETLAAVRQPSAVSDLPLGRVLADLQQQVRAVRNEPTAWYPLLLRLLQESGEALDRQLLASVESNAIEMDTETLRTCRILIERGHYQLETMQRELDALQPWLAFMAQPPPLFTQNSSEATQVTPFQSAWQSLCHALLPTPALAELAAIYQAGDLALVELQTALAQEPESPEVAIARTWCIQLAERLKKAAPLAVAQLSTFANLAQQADAYVTAMEFGFLFNEARQIFHIGYNIDAGLLDNSYYDLLASEARVASIIAIAKHDVPQSHWLHLGRPFTRLDNGAEVLLSWSGTMFEYLMPPLITRSYANSLLDLSCRVAIQRQISYGQQKSTPWGISESGFYTFDSAANYQYRAFGVPGLGLKRGLNEDAVISPYASLMALPFQPQAVLHNIELLKRYHLLGRYGFYEAVDFTPARLNLGQEYAVVRSYMAHHQGMIMLALIDTLQGEKMADRFHAEPVIQSIELLLQEQIPEVTPLHYQEEEKSQTQLSSLAARAIGVHPWHVASNTPLPLVHFLSNGRYGLLITNAGSGFSRWNDIALTRWRADTTLDEWGSWLYVQDLESSALWSVGRQPTGAHPDYQDVIFHAHKAEFRRRDHEIALYMEITVAPDEDVEIRRVRLTNDSDRLRQLRLTSYGEVVLAPLPADQRHPAFAKLFVESEYLAESNALLFRRRPRAAAEKPGFLVHMLLVGEHAGEQVWRQSSYESDRARFLGRNSTARHPLGLGQGAQLSRTVGATLDPIFALDQTLELPPHTTVEFALLTIAAETRETALNLTQRFRSWSVIERSFARAQTQAEQELRLLDLSGAWLEQMGQLLALLTYPYAARRAAPEVLAANQKGQNALWAFGISGDYPILLLTLHEEDEGELLQELLQIYIYWRRRNIEVDLVILNQQETNYGQPVQNFIFRIIRRMECDSWLNQRGGIYTLYRDQLNEGDRVLLQSAARIVLEGGRGLLAEQLANLLQRPTPLPAFVPGPFAAESKEELAPLTRPTDLQFDNGAGGFSADGKEYVIYQAPGQATPAPWINVVSNADFGFLISEVGSGYTWSINSGENRLTSWRNDPVSDQPAEVLYLRDEEDAAIWSPTPQPAPAPAPYLIRHGAGYTMYEHHSHNLRQQMRLFVAPDAPIKIIELRLENATNRPRRITATYYAEWVLGVHRDVTQQYILSEYDETRNALLARNPYNADFGERIAFLASSQAPHGVTADRSEFLGRLGTLSRPAALERMGLGNHLAAGLDPCAALQVHIDLAATETKTVYFLLGQGADRAEVQTLLHAYQDPAQVAATWQAVQTTWDRLLGTVTVATPDPAMNLLLNRWLLYQTLACRVWGRSALYQSSGAYGFRDQLQDVMALVYARPALTRDQILRAARHQFEAGDVLHWWHPPVGQGVRTRISDDLLWLPYVTAHYILATGDTGILDEQVPFRRGEPLREGEDERYARYEQTTQTETLYEHCRRALRQGTSAGAHGIPLMKAGDWNDGMNHVGMHGQGESIWLGWFLYATLTAFADVCESIQKAAEAQTYRQQAADVHKAVEAEGWDGQWYRRAYYDDGTPLGSAQNRECQLDSIAQSWAVLSGAAAPARARQAMNAVVERLVKVDERLILLFTPPFDKTPRDPGYIKGYLPGIRENGGQYTHAALWSIMALAQLGDGDQAEALFRLINPIYRADTPEKINVYKVEPYVIAADVYSVAPHIGRGGWTWYTGSSGWMYRLGVEAILGLQQCVHDDAVGLCFAPCIPKGWSQYHMTYQYEQTAYSIAVDNSSGQGCGVKQVWLDDKLSSNGFVALHDDGQPHQIKVILG